MDSWQERLKQAKIQSALKCALGLSPKPIYFHKAIWTFTGSLPVSRCHRSRRSSPNCERASPSVPLPGHFSPVLCATSGPGDGWQGTPQRPATPWREPPQNVLWPSDPQVVVTYFFFLLFSGSFGSHVCVFVGGRGPWALTGSTGLCTDQPGELSPIILQTAYAAYSLFPLLIFFLFSHSVQRLTCSPRGTRSILSSLFNH